MKTGDLSTAIVLFLGFGSASSPRKDSARLVQEFGAAQGALYETQVLSVIDEVGDIAVDWSQHSLQSAGEMVRAEMQRRHPDLSDEALRALAWKFTFDWR